MKEGWRLFSTAHSFQDQAKAIDKFYEAARIFEAAGLDAENARACDGIGIVYSEQGALDKALEYFQKSLRLNKKLVSRKGEAQSLNNIGVVLLKSHKFVEAREHFEKALDVYRALHDGRQQGRALNNIGIVNLRLGKYGEAEEAFKSAWKKAAAANDVITEVNCLTNYGETLLKRGRYVEAEQWLNEAMKRAQKMSGAEKVKAEIKLKLGRAMYEEGKYDKCQEYGQESLMLAERFKDSRMRALAAVLLGTVCRERGKYEDSEKYFRNALELHKKLNDKEGEADVLNSLGTLYHDWGRCADATKYFQESKKKAEDAHSKKFEARALNNWGMALSEQCEYKKAEKCFEDALKINADLGNGLGEGINLSNLGGLFRGQGRYDKSIKKYNLALQKFESLKDAKHLLQVHSKLGKIYQDQGKPVEAEKAFRESLKWEDSDETPRESRRDNLANFYLDQGRIDEAAKQVEIIKKTLSYRRKGVYNSSVGRFYLLKKEYKQASDYYQKLRESVEKYGGDLDDLFAAYTGLGLICEEQGDATNTPSERAVHLQNAKVFFEKAKDLTEKMRKALEPRERPEFFNVRTRGFLRTEPYKGLARVLFKMQKFNEAFEASDYTKVRRFAEDISLKYGEPSDPTRREIDRISEQITAQTSKQLRDYAEGKQDVAKELIPRIDSLAKKRQALLDGLRNSKNFRDRMFAEAVDPKPMKVEQLALREGEWLLAYDVTETGVLIYLVNGRKLKERIFKPIPRIEIDDLVRKFRKSVQLAKGEEFEQKLLAFDFSSGKKLSDILLTDVLPTLPKNAPLIIIPDGSLGLVPFEMLVLNEGGKIAAEKGILHTSGAKFFGDSNLISYYQAATALTVARTSIKDGHTGSRLFVLADPVFHRPEIESPKKGAMRPVEYSPDPGKGLTFFRLPATGELARDLKKEFDDADLYIRDDANKKKIMATLAPDRTGFGTLVFATHGLYDRDNYADIKEPIIALTQTPHGGTDRYLFMSEVMAKLRLNADLVALTACQTGLGRTISGEGVVNIGRAFQCVGARAVLASLWSAEEGTSVKLTKSFVLHRMKEGKSKLEALKLAREEIRKDGFDHPIFWAAFILVGEAD